MNTEMRSSETFKLLGLEITKRVFVDDSQVVQFFDFVHQGIPCKISTYGMNFGNKDEWHKRYSGLGETWNHCAYMILTEQQLSIVDPDFIMEYYRDIPEEEEEFYHHKPYAGGVFRHNEVTYTERQTDGLYQIGIDYQHGHNNADNTDLLTVLHELIVEVDRMMDEFGNQLK